jgi:hypothetical protein
MNEEVTQKHTVATTQQQEPAVAVEAQIVKAPADTIATQPVKRKRGRPKGSKNKPKVLVD